VFTALAAVTGVRIPECFLHTSQRHVAERQHRAGLHTTGTLLAYDGFSHAATRPLLAAAIICDAVSNALRIYL
jgi:hypothetical protein